MHLSAGSTLNFILQKLMFMIRSILVVLFSLLELATFAQSSQSIFEWRTNAEIVCKDSYLTLTKGSYSVSPKSKIYTHKFYTIKSQSGANYTLNLNSVNDPDPKLEGGYSGFSILYKGQSILTYYPGDPLYNCESITLEKDKSPFLQIPLDEKSFALCFGGWNFGIDNAPELVIVVVSEGKAKVVFDNYAYAYKYTPAPNFSIEFVDDIAGIGEDSEIYKKPSFLRSRTKHKIWREGNMLKYKSWK